MKTTVASKPTTVVISSVHSNQQGARQALVERVETFGFIVATSFNPAAAVHIQILCSTCSSGPKDYSVPDPILIVGPGDPKETRPFCAALSAHSSDNELEQTIKAAAGHVPFVCEPLWSAPW